jgi:hypothetical protein
MQEAGINDEDIGLVLEVFDEEERKNLAILIIIIANIEGFICIISKTFLTNVEVKR